MSLLIDYAHLQNRALDAKKAGNMLEVHPSVMLSMVANMLECCRVRDNLRADLESARTQPINLQLETMTADRDAEKRMKATARDQRDLMTKKYKQLVELLKTTGVFQLDQDWAIEIQNMVKAHKGMRK